MVKNEESLQGEKAMIILCNNIFTIILLIIYSMIIMFTFNSQFSSTARLLGLRSWNKILVSFHHVLSGTAYTVHAQKYSKVNRNLVIFWLFKCDGYKWTWFVIYNFTNIKINDLYWYFTILLFLQYQIHANLVSKTIFYFQKRKKQSYQP